MNTLPLILRAVEPVDVNFIFDLENDRQNWKVSNTLMPFSRYAIEQYALSVDADPFAQKQLRLIIDLSETNESIGCVDLFEIDPVNRRAGIGIILLEAYRHKGHAGKVIQQIVDYSKNVLNFHQLYCNISSANDASIFLFEKAGFVKCGIKKDWCLTGNEWGDEFMFQLMLE
jgi:diamine N-acetyltransferase